MAELRVFLVDDHAIVREGLRSLIGAQDGMTVVGESADGATACEQIPLLQVDVVILDVVMPGLTGAQTAERLRRECPDIKILAFSLHEDRRYLHQMLAAGAVGYAVKRAEAKELVRAIGVVAAGGTYLDPVLSSRQIGELLARSSSGHAATEELSERESEVLRLTAAGYGNKQIAGRLDLSVKSVETYRSRGMAKLHLHGRVELVRYAAQAGWFQNT